MDADNDERIFKLQARRIKVLKSRSARGRIKCCLATLAATQFPFEIQTADEVDVLNQTDPILKRIAALTTDAGLEENGAVAAVRTGDVTSEVSPENVARRWMVGLETAKSSMRVTTQQGVRSIPYPATRCFKTQMAHLRYPRLRGMFYADIMEPKVKSVDSHRYAHIIGNGKGYAKAYPMAKKNKSIYALDDFDKKVGIPETLLRRGSASTRLIQSTRHLTLCLKTRRPSTFEN